LSRRQGLHRPGSGHTPPALSPRTVLALIGPEIDRCARDVIESVGGTEQTGRDGAARYDDVGGLAAGAAVSSVLGLSTMLA